MKVSFKYPTKTQQGRCESSLSVHSTVKALYLHKQIVAIYDSEFSFATFDVYFGTYLQIRNPRLVSIHYFCGKGREVNLKIIFLSYVQDTIGGAQCAATQGRGRAAQARPTAPEGGRVARSPFQS